MCHLRKKSCPGRPDIRVQDSSKRILSPTLGVDFFLDVSPSFPKNNFSNLLECITFKMYHLRKKSCPGRLRGWVPVTLKRILSPTFETEFSEKMYHLLFTTEIIFRIFSNVSPSKCITCEKKVAQGDFADGFPMF
jgi:hypothetical protein